MESLSKRNVPMAQAWAELLQVRQESFDFWTGITVFYGRFGELRESISECATISERAKSLYTGAVNALLPYVTPSQLGGLNTGQLAGTQDKIDLLYLAADALPRDLIPAVHPSTLEQLCQELEKLLASAQGADVEPDVRRLITTSIETLLMVLRSYKHFGPDGAARIYGSVAAELARTMQQSPPESAAGKSALKKLIGVAKKIGAVVIWTSAVVGAGDKLLTDGTDIAKIITGPDQAAHGSKEGKAPTTKK